MHTLTDIKALLHRGELDLPVTIQGWVKNRRTSKQGVSFIDLSDGSTLKPLQVVLPETLDRYATVQKLTAGCAIKVTGSLVKSLGTKQAYELQATDLSVVGWVDDPATYPVAAKRHSLEHLREVAHLRPRTQLFTAIAHMRHTVARRIHEFFDREGFLWVSTPIITSADCEGAGELFQLSGGAGTEAADHVKGFFGKPAFLTVSGQLNAECYASALSKVYTFGPTFRAENSNTSRHLSEFWMVEPEMAFCALDGIIALAERLLKTVFSHVVNDGSQALEVFEQYTGKALIKRLRTCVEKPCAQIEYTEAIRILRQSSQAFEYPVSWGVDLASEHERFLAEHYFQGPVIVKNYPKAIKAFYMRSNDDGQTVAAMDLLAPGIGEILGGSQREERLDLLDQRMQACGISAEAYYWYRDLRRYGTVPHSGFGLGLERLLAYITGMDNLRDTIPFPRTPKHLTF